MEGARRKWVTSHGMEADMAGGERQGVALVPNVVGRRRDQHTIEKYQDHTTKEAEQRRLHGREGVEADLAALYTRENSGIRDC